jgi:hypothetical protein
MLGLWVAEFNYFPSKRKFIRGSAFLSRVASFTDYSAFVYYLSQVSIYQWIANSENSSFIHHRNNYCELGH